MCIRDRIFGFVSFSPCSIHQFLNARIFPLPLRLHILPLYDAPMDVFAPFSKPSPDVYKRQDMIASLLLIEDWLDKMVGMEYLFGKNLALMMKIIDANTTTGL